MGLCLESKRLRGNNKFGAVKLVIEKLVEGSAWNRIGLLENRLRAVKLATERRGLACNQFDIWKSRLREIRLLFGPIRLQWVNWVGEVVSGCIG